MFKTVAKPMLYSQALLTKTKAMHTPRAALFSGFQATLPLLLGIIPFGLIYGVSAAQTGLSTEATIGMSVLVFAGASQLAILQLLSEQAAVPVIIATGLIINLRFAMYSASIAPFFQDLPLRKRAGLAYVLTDQAYALAVHPFADNPTLRRAAYFVGAAVPFWLTWQVVSLIGFFVGTSVPAHWHLDFAIPLTFIALLVPAIKDRSTAVAAIVGAALAVGAAPLPYNLGLMLAALMGIGAGIVTEHRFLRSASPQ